MTIHVAGLSVAFMLLNISRSDAQTTDLNKAVASLLKDFGPVPVTTVTATQVRQCHWIYHRPRQDGMQDPPTCDPYLAPGPSQSQTQTKLLDASNIRIIAVQPISWGAMTTTNLPNQVYADRAWGQACTTSPGPLTAGYSLQVSVGRTSTVQLSKSVSQSQTTSANFEVAPLKEFKVGGQFSFGTQATVASVDIDATQRTVTYTHNDNWSVPPGKAAVVQIRAWTVQYTMPFSTTVIIDADLSANDKGLMHLSDIVPDPAKRTFPVAGTVTADDASAAHYVEYGVPYDPSQCGGGDLTPVKLHVASRTGQQMRLKKNHPL